MAIERISMVDGSRFRAVEVLRFSERLVRGGFLEHLLRSGLLFEPVLAGTGMDKFIVGGLDGLDKARISISASNGMASGSVFLLVDGKDYMDTNRQAAETLSRIFASAVSEGFFDRRPIFFRGGGNMPKVVLEAMHIYLKRNGFWLEMSR